jgi:hypothetical protein
MILISGALFRGLKYGKPKLATHAFSKPIDCPSLHIIGNFKKQTLQFLCLATFPLAFVLKRYI